MTSPDPARSVAGSLAVQTLGDHLEGAGAGRDGLLTILWMIGGHPELVAHMRIFKRLASLLASDVFAPASLGWAGEWQRELDDWRETLAAIDLLTPVLRDNGVFAAMFREPRHETHHPLLRHGVVRHPIAAALFNRHQSEAGDAPQSECAKAYLRLQAHVAAAYFEARWRAAQGREAFLEYDGDREFAAVPLGAGPVGLALREFSLADYQPLLPQLPCESNSLRHAYLLRVAQPSFAALESHARARAARYFRDLQSYVEALPTLLGSRELKPRTRTSADDKEGTGGAEHRSGWVDWQAGGFESDLDKDWTDEGPTIRIVSYARNDEDDPVDEEAMGACPREARDDPLEYYDPQQSGAVTSRMRFRDLALQRRAQELHFSTTTLTPFEFNRAACTAQEHINAFLDSPVRNQSTARLRAVGGIVVKAAGAYGWAPDITAAITVKKVGALNQELMDSLLFIEHQQVVLLVTGADDDPATWRAEAFLVPGLSPTYQTRLPEAVERRGRTRQRAFLLADALGLGKDLLRVAHRAGRLISSSQSGHRVLGVETKTATSAGRNCIDASADPICEDPRAMPTLARLRASVRIHVEAVAKDAAAAWLVTCDASRVREPRLFYTQIRASRLVALHARALQVLMPEATPSTADVNSLTSLQQGWVGCRHVVDFDQLATQISTLRDEVEMPVDLGRRSAIRSYHNTFTLYTWLMQSLAFGLRPIAHGFGLQSFFERWSDIPASVVRGKHAVATVVDKHNGYQDRARLIPITATCWAQLVAVEAHNSACITRLDLLGQWQAAEAGTQRLFGLSDEEDLLAVTPKWIEQQLANRGFAVPANFGRAFLRTEWADAGIGGQLIDATLGHCGRSQGWYGRHSSHDPSAFLDQLDQQAEAHLRRLGMTAIRSRCVPASDYNTLANLTWPLPAQGRQAPVARLSTRPPWQGVTFPPTLPENLNRLWSAVRRHAADADGHCIDELLWLMRQCASSHAQCLTGRIQQTAAPLDAQSAGLLVDELHRATVQHRLPRTRLASWLRLLLSAEKRFQAEGVDIAATPVLALTAEPTSPINTVSTIRLSNLELWREALHAWVRLRAEDRQEDPRYWAVAILVSAVVHGMAVDLLFLSRLLEHLSTPGPRSLHVLGGDGGPSYLEFMLPSSTPGGRQRTRWFLDPLTELIVLSAPPFLDPPDLRSTGRDLNAFLRHHGVSSAKCPGGWRTVVKVARAHWSTVVPQYLVQLVQRGVSATSLEPNTWTRLFGSTTLHSRTKGAILKTVAADSVVLTLHQLKAVSKGAERDDASTAHQVDRAAAIAGTESIRAAEVDHVSADVSSVNTWLSDAMEALSAATPSEALARLQTFQRLALRGSLQQGCLTWLINTAEALLALQHIEGGGYPLVALRRNASTLLPRLIMECGGRWVDTMNAAERHRVQAAVLHELEQGTSRPDLLRGLGLLWRYVSLPDADGASVEALSENDQDDLGEEDDNTRVDARMLVIDEYLQAVDMIRSGIDPPLSARDRHDLDELLTLCVWSGARPRECLEARVGDLQAIGEQLHFMIQEFAGHTLKTPHAVRAVPLSLIAPSDALSKIRTRVERLLAERNDCGADSGQRRLIFEPPAGVAAKTHHDRLLALLTRVLRNVTGDQGFRVYSLRHSAANWLLLALENDGSDSWEHAWSRYPAMLSWLRHGAELRSKLLLTDDRLDRRAVLAITTTLGHLCTATTFLHYLHTTCFLQLQAVLKAADDTPDVVMAAAAHVSRSTFCEQRKGGWKTVLAAARSRAGWVANAPAITSTSPATMSRTPTRWLDVHQFQQMLDAHAVHDQPIDAIAKHFDLGPSTVVQMINIAAKHGGLVRAHVRSSESADMPPYVLAPPLRLNPSERLQAQFLLRNIEQLSVSDAELAQQGLTLYMLRLNRHFGDVAFDDTNELAIFARFIQALEVGPREIQIILRRRDGCGVLSASAARALGKYALSTIKCVKPQSRGAEAAHERWVALQFVDRRGEGITHLVSRVMLAAYVSIAVQR